MPITGRCEGNTGGTGDYTEELCITEGYRTLKPAANTIEGSNAEACCEPITCDEGDIPGDADCTAECETLTQVITSDADDGSIESCNDPQTYECRPGDGECVAATCDTLPCPDGYTNNGASVSCVGIDCTEDDQGTCCTEDQDCIGEWGSCGVDCNRTYTVTSALTGSGADCEAENGAVEECSPGVDQCPVDCDYGSPPDPETCTSCDEILETTPTSTPAGRGNECPDENRLRYQCSPGDGGCYYECKCDNGTAVEGELCTGTDENICGSCDNDGFTIIDGYLSLIHI